MLLLIDTWSAACSWRLRLHQLLDRQPVLGESLLDPGQRQCQRRALALQAARELRHERARHRRVRTRHVGDHQDQALRILLRDLQHPVGPRIGQVAIDRRRRERDAHATQVLDQRQPQHDRDGPQLAQLERCHRLVGRDEARQALPHRPGRRRARSPRARCRRRAAARPRDPAPGAAAPGCSPSAGAAWRCGSALRSGRSCRAAIRRPGVMRRFAVTAAVSRSQASTRTSLVLGQPRQQLVGPSARCQAMRSREALAVLLHLVGAEQLRAQRRLVLALPLQGAGAAEPRREPEQPLEDRSPSQLQFRNSRHCANATIGRQSQCRPVRRAVRRRAAVARRAAR